MDIVLISGSAGLVGSSAAEFLSGKFDLLIGIDNDMRANFFGAQASTKWNRDYLQQNIANYIHYDCDIRNNQKLQTIFEKYRTDIKLVIHTAAQPSHDWASHNPIMDFTINANGTLNLLELTRLYSPDAVFIFTSTNKVYGDRPNALPFVEKKLRWEIEKSHPYFRHGIDESMSIDQSLHSIFGASKLSADIAVQEYGRYFGMKTVVFRGGCLTGPKHSSVTLHGFLSYLMKCTVKKIPYTIFGYKGKQVRDNMHSFDLVNMFWHFYRKPRKGEVYNAGGCRFSNCSILEAINLCEKISGNRLKYEYIDRNRIGDHIWWISDISKFRSHYPNWSMQYSTEDILKQIFEETKRRL